MNPSQSKVKKWLILFFQGSLMGASDLIPGVSGGTLALVFGIHSKLLESLKTLKPKAIIRPKTIAWFFLTAILCGIFFSLAFGAKFICYLLNNPKGLLILHSAFFGLVLGSLFFCLPKVGKWTTFRVFLFFLGTLSALSLIWVTRSSEKKSHYSVRNGVGINCKKRLTFAGGHKKEVEFKSLTQSSIQNLIRQNLLDESEWIYHEEAHQMVLAQSCLEFTPSSRIDYKLFFCGTLAICAMLLPGVSGSQVMVLFGFYDQIIHAIALWVSLALKGDFLNDPFWFLFQLGLGILAGVLFFSRFATYLYNKYPENFISLLIGFMAGSLPTVWPFWKTNLKVQISSYGPFFQLDKIKPTFFSAHHSENWMSIGIVVLSISLLLLLKKLEKKKQLRAS